MAATGRRADIVSFIGDDAFAPKNEPALAGGVRVVLGSFSAATVIA
jgi:hypothetical protein